MDTLTTSAAVILTVCAVLLSGLFSGTEIAYVQSSKVRIGIDASKGGLISRIISSWNRHQDMFISTILVGNNVVLVVYGIAISVLINPWLKSLLHSEGAVLVANTLISTTIILVTGEFLPKTVFRINPNMMLKLFALPIFLIYIVLYPVSLFTSALSNGLMRLLGIKSPKEDDSRITIDQIDSYIQHAIDEKPADAPAIENEVKIFQNAIDFKDTYIRDCMTPRNEITAVDLKTTTRAELVARFTATGLSKIVVYDGDIDDVKGYIHVWELFDTDADWRRCLKPVLFTPETMLANTMMRRLLAQKKSMAIVVDEFGGTAGLVTLEDLVEEIFGEIQDEHDRDNLIMRQTAQGVYELSGRAEIETINERFGLDMREDDDYQTIAGFILHSLEALPAPGSEFAVGRYQFKILKMTASRIELLTMRVLPETEEK